MWVETALALVCVFVSAALISRRARLTASQFAGKCVLITGGSSGIGLALAQEFLSQCVPKKVILVARNKEGLQKAKIDCLKSDPRVEVFSLDVAQAQACKNATSSFGEVDVLINAAGLSIPGRLEDLTDSDVQTMVNVNLLGSLHLTKCLVPLMKKRKNGHVVFVSSQAGQVGLYGFTVYSATKYALRGLAEALRMETLAHNVDVSVVFPADTETPGLAKENESKPRITKLLSETSGVMTAQAVAKLIVDGMHARRFLITVNFDGWMLNMLSLGMSGISNTFAFVTELALLPVFRVVAAGYSLYFDRIVRLNDTLS